MIEPIWPSAETEKTMLADAARLARISAGVSTGADCALHIQALLARVRELEAEMAKLREALKPFAEQAKIIDAEDAIHRIDGKRPEFSMFRFADSYAAITIGDCRKAQEALK